MLLIEIILLFEGRGETAAMCKKQCLEQSKSIVNLY